MQIQWVYKDTHLLYLSLFIPFSFHCKNLHALEHRFFLDKDLLRLEEESIDFNGVSLRNGILLKFVIHKNQYHKLFSILEKIFKWSLSPWNKWEKLRFEKELQEEKEDIYIFHQLKKRWYKEFYKINGIKEDRSSADKLWEKYINFNNIRCSIIWNIWDEYFSDSWKVNELNYSLPVISNKYNNKKYWWTCSITIFTPTRIQSSLNMYFLDRIYNVMLSKFLQEKYLDTWNIYDYDGYTWNDNGVILRGTHISDITNIICISDITFKIPTKTEFMKLKKQCVSELQYSYDMMNYQSYVVLWFTPEDESKKIEAFNYKHLRENWNEYLSTISLIYS
jgi:hypothetical protein